MSFAETEALVRRFAAAFNQGDLDVIDQVIARRFFNYVPAAGEETAAEVVRQLAGDMRAALPDLTVGVADFVDQGETVQFSLNLNGNHTGTLWGAPASGSHFEWTSTVTGRLVDGKLAFEWRDLAPPTLLGVLRQIDLVPPPDQMDKPGKHPIVVPEFLLKVLFTGQVAEKPCAHLDQIQVFDSDTTECPQCVALGDVWPALRMCLICGFVGCCDTSKNKHMKQHYETTGHSIFRSIRLQESWVWCYEDNAFFSKKTLDSYRP